MMNVQRMRYIVDDVERDALPEVVRVATLRWCEPAEIDSLQYVRSSANHLYRFLHAGQPRYLRLAHTIERRLDALAAELDFVQHVGRAGLAVAAPVASAYGRLIEDVADRGHHYWAVVFEGLQGREYEVDELDEAGYRAWGCALAQLHQASQTFPPHPARPVWRDELQATLQTLPVEETAVANILTAGLRWLDSLTIPDQDYGLLHGDFELDNLVWNDEQAQTLDFDDAAYGWYAADVAMALHDVWLAGDMNDADSKTTDERVTWFTEGYATVRPLPDGLREALPRLHVLLHAVKMARLLRAYAPMGENTGDDADPEWLAQMRTHHFQWLEAQRAVLIWE